MNYKVNYSVFLIDVSLLLIKNWFIEIVCTIIAFNLIYKQEKCRYLIERIINWQIDTGTDLSKIDESDQNLDIIRFVGNNAKIHCLGNTSNHDD